MTRKVWSAAACSEHVHVYLQIGRPVFVERSIQRDLVEFADNP